jgi:hypothetical protein
MKPRLWAFLIGCLVTVQPILVSAQGDKKAKDHLQSARATSKENLKKLALAMWNFYDLHGHFPPSRRLVSGHHPMVGSRQWAKSA